MRGRVIGGLAIATAGYAMVLATSCGDDVYTAAASSDSGGGVGNEGQPCFPAGTCNSPFVCVSKVCSPNTAKDAEAQFEAAASLTCPYPVPLSSVPTYAGPNVTYGLGSCTPADMTAFTQSYDTPDSDPSDWYPAVSPDCQKCIFSGQSDSTWQILVIQPNLTEGLAASDVLGFINIGPCYQEAPGGTAACGKAAQDFNGCVQLSCPSPSCDSDLTCIDDAKTSTCAAQRAVVPGACGATFDSVVAYCAGADGEASILDLVIAVCGAGTQTDAGASDASTD